MRKKRNAFTLIELLAVIVILAVILVIAIPRILDVIDVSKKDSFKTSVQLIADSAEKKYVENKLNNIDEEITCESVTKLSKEDYVSCKITFDNEGNAKVNIIGKGKFKDLAICNGTKTSVEIPNTVTSIGRRVFSNNKLTNSTIIFPTTPLTIDCHEFDSNLEEIIYPSNVTIVYSKN